MPELPEVESVCRMMRRELVGHQLTKVQAASDPIVFKGIRPHTVEKSLEGKKVLGIGRKGKTFWLTLEDGHALLGHLGMSGWVEPLEQGDSEPKFLKLIVETERGKRIAFTDARRLGRIWLADDPKEDPKVKALGVDAYDELPSVKRLGEMLSKRRIPIKAALLDQGLLSGVGNYLADEVLYQARIAPSRHASDLSTQEISKLRGALKKVLATAVEADADSDRFPASWLFHHRWGGSRGHDKIGRYKIQRDTIGGRTTAWVPGLQK